MLWAWMELNPSLQVNAYSGIKHPFLAAQSNHSQREHLVRCHTPPAFKNPLVCGRCLEGFKSQDLVVQHLQGAPPCLIKSPEIINGKVTLEQAVNLRSMKRKRSDMAEEGMWFEIFQIFFPANELPASPCMSSPRSRYPPPPSTPFL